MQAARWALVKSMNELKLGIPKGSLEDATISLFRQAGWEIRSRSRNYFPSIDDPEISCALVRSQEMPMYVGRGNLDLGLTGLDWMLESEIEVEEVCDLVYSKNSDQPCRWVLVVLERLSHSVCEGSSREKNRDGTGSIYAPLSGRARY